MKKNNNKGFTLIELLAVIVVLALVMVLATTTVLPLMSTARKRTFAMDATNAVESATNVASLIPLGAVTPQAGGTGSTQLEYSRYVNTSTSTITYCFTLYEIQRLGYYKVDASRVGTKGTGELAGKVIIQEVHNADGSVKYNYRTVMRNKEYKLKDVGGKKGTNGSTFTEDNVEEWSGTTTSVSSEFSCTNNESSNVVS